MLTRRTIGWVALSLVVTILAIYGPVANFEFVNYDDDVYVYRNEMVLRGISIEGLKWAFTVGHAANFHPLTWIVHMVDSSLYGLHAGGHHVSSLGFHALNSVLLFLVLMRLTAAGWPAALVALLFAIHPAHVESVAWISERKDLLSTGCWILVLGAYQAYVTARHSRSRGRWYSAALILYALGLLAKPMLVTLPFVLLLLDFWPLRRVPQWGQAPSAGKNRVSIVRLITEKLPFFVLTVGSAAITLVAQSRGGAMQSAESLPMIFRLLNTPVSYVTYVGKLLWPTKLACFYPYRLDIPSALVILSVVVLASVTILVWRLSRRYPYYVVGWLWFLGTLVPVIGLVQVGNQAIADRYTYIPSIGLFIMIAWGLQDLARTRHRQRLVIGTVAITIVSLMIVASRQVRTWANSETLYTHALAVTENNWVAHNNYGHKLLEDKRVAEAIGHFEESIRLRPRFASAHYNLANAYTARGRFTEAMTHYEFVLKSHPDSVQSRNDLGNIYLKMGRPDDARLQFREALRYAPEMAEAYNNLGNAQEQLGRLPEAIDSYKRALELKPNYRDAHNNLGAALADSGDFESAMAHYEAVLAVDPTYLDARNNLGVALAAQGLYQEALEEYRKVLALDPQHQLARRNVDFITERLRVVNAGVSTALPAAPP
ncbi:MAG: tetratricopeptide repeat protein [Verrucomicrobia bacterium]|nr:tetratricopeptide repeat protein [Verrucomicrobiota bacterium]